jgi:hypothetical protein
MYVHSLMTFRKLVERAGGLLLVMGSVRYLYVATIVNICGAICLKNIIVTGATFTPVGNTSTITISVLSDESYQREAQITDHRLFLFFKINITLEASRKNSLPFFRSNVLYIQV